MGGTENFRCRVLLDTKGTVGYAWGEFLAQVVERSSFNGQHIWAVSNKPVFGMYLNREFRTESLAGGRLCLLTVWEFADAEAHARAFGLFELNLETRTATLLGNN